MKGNTKKKGFVTLGFDPHGGKHDLMWKRIEGFDSPEAASGEDASGPSFPEREEEQ